MQKHIVIHVVHTHQVWIYCRFLLLGVIHAWSYMAFFEHHELQGLSNPHSHPNTKFLKFGWLLTSTPFKCTKLHSIWISFHQQ